VVVGDLCARGKEPRREEGRPESAFGYHIIQRSRKGTHEKGAAKEQKASRERMGVRRRELPPGFLPLFGKRRNRAGRQSEIVRSRGLLFSHA
jgi:hypothetical protein